MKTILYVIPEFPVASETFITTEIKAIERQGHRVVPVCLKRRDEPCQAGDETLNERFLSLSDVSFVAVAKYLILWGFQLLFALLKGDEYLLSVWAAFLFAREQKGVSTRSVLFHGMKVSYLVWHFRAQHIHCHFAWSPAVMGITAARLSGISVSFTSHGSDVYKTPQNLQSKLQNADFVVAVCKRMLDEFQTMSPETPVVHIPCGVDTHSFHPAHSDKPQGKNNKLLFLGRLSETKGLPDLVNAIAKCDADIEIDIAGDGPMKQSLQEQVAELGLHQQVHFIGAVSRQWVMTHITDYQALVLPFCKTADGIMDTGPLVLKEAMACKVPVVTTDLMASGEILDPHCAWVARHNDADDLARVLNQLVEDLSQADGQQRIRAKTGLAHHKLTCCFSANVCASQLSRQFESAHAGYQVEVMHHEI